MALTWQVQLKLSSRFIRLTWLGLAEGKCWNLVADNLLRVRD